MLSDRKPIPCRLATRVLLRLLLVLFTAGVSSPASASPPTDVTEAEMSLIPRYCRVSMGHQQLSEAFMGYVRQYGEGFKSVHHYCWGQIRWQRALRSTTPDHIRDHLFEVINADYHYVVTNSPSDFVLLPEVYTRIGQVALRRSIPDEANKAFAKARALRPDYWPAYSHWAEFLISVDKRSDALTVVQAGLKHSPHSKVLQAQNRLLAGKAARQ